MKLSWTGSSILSLTSLSLLLAACSGGFEARTTSSRADLASADLPAAALDGVSLYKTNCSACHGSLDGSSKQGRQSQQIVSAIETVPSMSSLKLLSSAQVSAIANALAAPVTIQQCDDGKLIDGGARRLNAREFRNSVKSLLGVTVSAALPPDGRNTNDFDTDGSSLHLLDYDADKYYVAIESALSQAFAMQPSFLQCGLQDLSTTGTAATNCIRATLGKILRRAHRRPISPAATESYVALSATEGNPIDGLKKSLQAVFLSPSFLFIRTNQDLVRGRYRLTSYELAERMSFFLWSNVPDEELLSLADSGALANPATARAQVVRMIRHPDFKNFLDGFVKQWLTIDDLANLQRDSAMFPEASKELFADMSAETTTFFNDLVQNDRAIGESLTSSTTFVNQRLASFYGLGGVSGTNFRKVTLPAAQRRGFLTHASVMAGTGSAGRTSPTHRGFWITRKITCTPPPPPPASIPPLAEAGQTTETTIRERLEVHRQSGACISCHQTMDPLGLAFEPFDGIGKWRSTYSNGLPIVTRDTVFGRNFDGPLDLAAMLSEGHQFKACVAENLATYAIGRALSSTERCYSRNAALALKKDSFTELISEIVVSELFQSHVAEPN